jgi:hypothetical protein
VGLYHRCQCMRCSIFVSNEAAHARLCWATRHVLVAQTKRLHFLVADQALLLPLTQSLYVKGKVAETEKVMVNIGTDYYVEVSRRHGACRQFLSCLHYCLASQLATLFLSAACHTKLISHESGCCSTGRQHSLAAFVCFLDSAGCMCLHSGMCWV